MNYQEGRRMEIMEQKFLDDVKHHLNLTETEFLTYLDNVNRVEEILEKNGVKFTYEFMLVFYSHIISYCQRLETKERLNVTNSGFEDEVSEKAYKISSEILTMLVKEYSAELDDLEIILAAIQIQLALEIQEQ